MLKNCLKILFGMLVLLFLSGCKNPNGPEDPDNTPKYKYNVEVTYNRDVTKITYPAGNDEATYLFGELYDPQIAGGKQSINIKMTKVAENRFICTISKIWVNTANTFHVLKVQDYKLIKSLEGNPNTNRSCDTGEDIEIPGSYNHKIVTVYSVTPIPNGSELWFMIK